MDINVKFDFVKGAFDTDIGKLICVKKPDYGRVSLCFKESMNIAFSDIKLHSSDLLVDAQEVMNDAYSLGNEISKRWNAHKGLLEVIEELQGIASSWSHECDYTYKRLQEMRDKVCKIVEL